MNRFEQLLTQGADFGSVEAQLLTLAALLYFPVVQADSRNLNIDKVMGGITIPEDTVVGNLETINGGITVEDGSEAGTVETVNGGIELGDRVKVHSAATVNGSIEVKEDVRIEEGLSTVNGGISVEENSRIGGDLETVNGGIQIRGSVIDGNLTTVNGSIRLRDKARVRGDIIFEKPQGYSGYPKPPMLRIDAGVSVEGTIHLYREIRLNISEDASVGEIIRHYL